MIHDLTPEFDSRKSFGGKAQIEYLVELRLLYSYGTRVATINPETRKVALWPRWDDSQTTLRHVKEFLKQHGFTAETKTQIANDYA